MVEVRIQNEAYTRFNNLTKKVSLLKIFITIHPKRWEKNLQMHILMMILVYLFTTLMVSLFHSVSSCTVVFIFSEMSSIPAFQIQTLNEQQLSSRASQMYGCSSFELWTFVKVTLAISPA